MTNILNSVVLISGSILSMAIGMAVILGSAGYGIYAVHLLEFNGHMGLAAGFAFITLLIMALQFYFLHRTLDWLFETF